MASRGQLGASPGRGFDLGGRISVATVFRRTGSARIMLMPGLVALGAAHLFTCGDA
jgi:hypothetical protein